MEVARGLGLVVVLLSALILQAASFWWGQSPVAGPMAGDTLPAVSVQPLGQGDASFLSEAVSPRGECGLVYIMSTRCVFCNRLRATWAGTYRAWADSVGREVDVLWLVEQDEATVRSWLRGWDLPGVRAATVPSAHDEAWRKLGVIGTPISYLIDRSGHVAVGVAGPRLPPSALTRRACLDLNG